MPRPELSTLRYPNLWQGCVGAWCPSQSGATGYRLFDDSGNNNHGTLTNMDPGTDWVPSSNKLALDFDGVDDVVTCPQPQYSYPVTINFWARIVSAHNAYVVVLTNGATTDASFGFVSNLQDLRLVGFQMQHGNLGIGVLSNWTMLTYSLESQTYRAMYINGAFSISNTTSASLPTMSSIRIGGGDFGARKLNGALDDVRIYNRVLTPQEIRLLYTGGRGAAYERSRGRKKAYVPGYRITAPSRIQTGSARTIDGTDTESLSRGLVGAWCPSLGASGYRLLDRSGYGNHGTLTNMDPGTDWVPSGGKLALDFDGVNDYVQLTDVNLAKLSRRLEAALSFWVYPRSTSRNTYIADWNASGQGQSVRIEMSGFEITSGRIGGALSNGTMQTSSSVELNRWHHFVIQRNTAGNGQLYWNGVLDDQRSNTTMENALDNPITIGRAGSFAAFYANTQLDDIRIYNRVLTPSEIRLLYTGGRGVGLLPEAKPKRARIVAWDNQDKISVPARVLTNTDSLKRGLVGHWSPSVSGPQGNRLMDLSGQNNHGTLTNMDYQTDYVPSTDKGGRMALDFDGSNDVIITDRNSPITTNRMSVSAWVYPLETGRGDYVNLWNFSNVGQFQFNLLQGVTASKFQFFVSSGTLYSSGPSSATISTGRWYHLTGIFDGVNVSLYVNGVFDSTGSAPITLAQPTIPTVRIGNNYDGDGAFQGQIDDIRLYNRALTPSEIRLLAQSRQPERATPQRTRTVFYSSGLVSYLRRRTYNSILGSGVLS